MPTALGCVEHHAIRDLLRSVRASAVRRPEVSCGRGWHMTSLRVRPRFQQELQKTGLCVRGGSKTASDFDYLFLWHYHVKYFRLIQSKGNGIMNPQVPITQFQQLATYGQSWSIYTLIYLPCPWNILKQIPLHYIPSSINILACIF